MRRPSDPLGRPGFTLIEVMLVVAIIAVLAVVAIPQFQQYIRHAKATEAVTMLDVMRKGAAAYYAVPRTIQETGKRAPCRFPKGAGLTPVAASCCDPAVDKDNDDRCDSAPQRWSDTSWSALKFALTDAHYYQYTFSTSGEMAAARFAGSAHADLDCDGIFSTFEVMTAGDPKATGAECDSTSSSAFFRDHETE